MNPEQTVQSETNIENLQRLRREYYRFYNQKREERENVGLLTPQEEAWAKLKPEEIPSSLIINRECLKLFLPGQLLLDFGSGPGEETYKFAEMGLITIGLDINSDVIRTAKLNSHPNSDFMVMNCSHLKENLFENISIVNFQGTIGGIEPKEGNSMLEKGYDVLHSGGMMVISEFMLDLNDPENVRKYKRDKDITGEELGIKLIIDLQGHIRFVTHHFTKENLEKKLLDLKLHSIESRIDEVLSIGPGDGKLKRRKQLTVWGFKPEEKIIHFY